MSPKQTAPHDDQDRTLYGRQWDQFYASAGADGRGKALWDVDPERAFVRDHAIFSSYINKALPVVDYGCGTGRQTAAIGHMYAGVIGMDISARAIDIARQQCGEEDVKFLTIEASDANFFPRLHSELGDVNVYMGGVLHQVYAADVSKIVEALGILIGSTGRLFLIEVANNIRDYLRSESETFTRLPDAIQKTMISRLPPRGLCQDELLALFPPDRFSILTSGDSKLCTNLVFQNDNPMHIPAIYAVVGAKVSP